MSELNVATVNVMKYFVNLGHSSMLSWGSACLSG